MKLRVGVVGLGHSWEKRYRPALRSLSDRYEVRAFCEPVAMRAAQVADEFHADAIDGFQALARREDIDAVLVLSRQWFGALPILAACEAGKAIYCCTGLETDVLRAAELKRRIEQSGVTFMAELSRRYAPATVRLKELIATRLGPPKLLFCHLRSPVERTGNGRLGDARSSSIDALMELVDWCRYVVGRNPVSVVGISHDGGAGSFDSDYEMMSLDFSVCRSGNGSTIAQLSCGRYMPAAWHEASAFRPPAALQVACENGIAFVDLPATLIWFDKAGRHQESLESERPIGETLLLQFYRNVTSLVRQASSLDDAHQALSIVLAAQQSHRENRRVFLKDADRPGEPSH